MRLALLQIPLTSRHRADNVQELMAAIDRAADIASPPDLCVLPGAVDSGGRVPAGGRSGAFLDGLQETVAYKAREWGIYIAAGMHLRQGDAWEPCAVLFDPDGDVVVRPSARVTGSDTDKPERLLWPTPIGLLGAMDLAAVPRGGVFAELEGCSAVVAVPVRARSSQAGQRATKEALHSLRTCPPAGGGSFWAVASSADTPEAQDGEGTFVRSPDGTLLAAARSGHESILQVELAIEPEHGIGQNEVDRPDGHAD